MSRIGKQPIELPSGVTATIDGSVITVTGPKGSRTRTLRPEVDVRVEGSRITVAPRSPSRKTPAYWGLTRAIVASMVTGVSQGFQKKLEIEGVGYRATLDGKTLQLALGFSHPVRIEPPEGVTFVVEKSIITVSGSDAELVGDTAAAIRRIRPPEPYKGKGIHYLGEVIRRKAGKKAAAAAA